MCFTIEVHLTRKAIEKRFSVDASALYDFDFRYFYRAFSNPLIPVITQNASRHVQLMQWGLIPSWAGNFTKAQQIRTGTYNARSESLHEKPSFREPFRSGRCLVIAHGFFEWQLVSGVKVPWYIRLKSNTPFAFAGLHDSWQDPDNGELCHTFSIITTVANPMMEKIHNTKKRMPVILNPAMEHEWISGELPLFRAKKLLTPIAEGELHAHTVSPLLSKADAQPTDPKVIIPYKYPVHGLLF